MDGVFGKKIKDSIVPASIDGDMVGGESAASAFIPLSPGSHDIGVVFDSSSFNKMIGSFKINAQPGEHYKINDKVYWDDTTTSSKFADILNQPRDVTAVQSWIEDSKGHRITPILTTKISITMTVVPRISPN